MDIAHGITDEKILVAEAMLMAIYRKANKAARGIVSKYAAMLREEFGEVPEDATEDEYEQLVGDFLSTSSSVQDLVRELAEYMVGVDESAMGVINDQLPEVCDENNGYMLYLVAMAIGVSLAMSGTTIAKVPVAKVDRDKDLAWNMRKMLGAVRSGMMLDKGYEQVGRNVSAVVNMEMRSSKRAMRTAMTRAEAVGRMDALRKLAESGVGVEKEWVAVMDDRTRQSHRYLDGQHVPIDEPFVTEGGAELMYPADPNCNDPSEVYNCRCTLRPWLGKTVRLGPYGMTYEEWKSGGRSNGGQVGQ